ncbi:MAG: ECF-type sigma factor [Acidobacteriota bacterium]|nr:ECF-type sigma factor [Acidobacteriota bacterium]
MQFWKRPNGFNPARSNLKAYLFGIARKKAADWWRQHGTTKDSCFGVASNNGDSAFLINDALKRIDPDFRNVLWLREIEGYSYEELASILDIPLGTVKSRLFSAREQLRRVWKTCE